MLYRLRDPSGAGGIVLGCVCKFCGPVSFWVINEKVFFSSGYKIKTFVRVYIAVFIWFCA